MLSAGLPVLKNRAGLPALCLVTGATGYIGGRLVVELLNHGYRVRVLARNPERLKDHPWINKVEVASGDANDEFALTEAMQGVDVAYSDGKHGEIMTAIEAKAKELDKEQAYKKFEEEFDKLRRQLIVHCKNPEKVL